MESIHADATVTWNSLSYECKEQHSRFLFKSRLFLLFLCCSYCCLENGFSREFWHCGCSDLQRCTGLRVFAGASGTLGRLESTKARKYDVSPLATVATTLSIRAFKALVAVVLGISVCAAICSTSSVLYMLEMLLLVKKLAV